MPTKSFIRDLYGATDGLTPHEVNRQNVEVEVDAEVVQATRILGLLSLQVKDLPSTGESPLLSVAVTRRTKGFIPLIELQSLIGKKVRIAGTLKKSSVVLMPQGGKPLVVQAKTITLL